MFILFGRATGATALAVAILVSPACSDPDAAKRRYVESGNRFAAERRYTEAILEYRNALRFDRRYADARRLLADALAASGNAEGAQREYVRAADLLPNDLVVQKKAATLLFIAGEFGDVRSRAEGVLKQNPRDLEAQLLYANALVGLRDLEGGIREIEEAIHLDPAHATPYTNLGLLQLAKGQREAAHAAFQKAVELDPSSLKARHALSHFLLATGNLPAAEQSLLEALKISPRNPLTNRALAALLIATGREELAQGPLEMVAEVTGAAPAKLALAEYYARLERVNEARAVLEPMVRDARTYADAQTRLAQLAYGLGDRDPAKRMVDQVLAKHANFALALEVKARWLLNDGQLAAALERASSAAAAAPRDVGVLYLKGIAQALNGERQAAAKTFNDVLRLNPRAAAAQVQLAQLSLSAGDSSVAVGLAQEAVANAPRLAEAHLLLARALIAQRELTRAAGEIERLLALHPHAATVHALKGTLSLLTEQALQARASFQRAFEIDPGSIAALNGLTLLDAREGRLAAARARVEGQLARQPGRLDLLVIAAKVYAGAGDLRSAERVLKQAIQLAPAAPDAYILLGEVYRAQQRLDPARAEFDAAVARNPANVGARTMAAMLVHAQQKPAEAKVRYTQVLELDPRAAVAANNLAWIYADEQQNLDVALQLAERATELMPGYAEAMDTLGWVYFRKQLPFLAVQPFERAVAKDPENATFHYHLGLALVASGDRVNGRQSLQTALRLRPAFADAMKELSALDQ